MTLLQRLSADSNKLSGLIPTSLGNLLSVDILTLSLNNLIGPIPDTISALTKLKILEISSNLLTGTIPSSISKLTALTEMSLYHCSLSGTIPSTMSALIKLGILDLRNNYLTAGSSMSVPTSTFSTATLNGTIRLDFNCLAFSTSAPYPSRSVTATHCRPTSMY